jgi:hypothetical protein
VEILIIGLIFWFVCGLVASTMFESRGHSGCSGFLLGFLFGPLGIVIAAVTPPTQATVQQNQQALDSRRLVTGELKRCPYCAELVKRQAIVCRYCGRDLTTPSARPVAPTSPTPVAVVSSRLPTICPQCGAENKREDRFCVMCGIPLFPAAPMSGNAEAGSGTAAPNEPQVIQPSGQPEIFAAARLRTHGTSSWVGPAILGAVLLGGLLLFVCVALGAGLALRALTVATPRAVESSQSTVPTVALVSLNPTAAPTLTTVSLPSPATSPTRTRVPNPTPRPTPVRTATVPNVVVDGRMTVDEWEITLSRVTFVDRVSALGMLEKAHGRFALVFMKVTNRGYSQDTFVAFGILVMKGASGTVSEENFVASGLAQNQFGTDIGASINPDASANVVAAFDVSTSSASYTLLPGSLAKKSSGSISLPTK